MGLNLILTCALHLFKKKRKEKRTRDIACFKKTNQFIKRTTHDGIVGYLFTQS